MSDALLSTLADYGALGIMVLFLIWQHMGMQKRLDGLVDSFRQDTESMNVAFDERISVLRSRYEVVIEGIRKECREAEDKVTAQRDKLQADLAETIKDADRKLDMVIARLDRDNG